MSRDVTIHAPVAVMGMRAGLESIQHHCPFCNQTFDWPTFTSHLRPCLREHDPDAGGNNGELHTSQ